VTLGLDSFQQLHSGPRSRGAATLALLSHFRAGLGLRAAARRDSDQSVLEQSHILLGEHAHSSRVTAQSPIGGERDVW